MNAVEIRNQIVELCKKAGLWQVRIDEIAGGCSSGRICTIIDRDLYDAIPGTPVYSDVNAAIEAQDLAGRFCHELDGAPG